MNNKSSFILCVFAFLLGVMIFPILMVGIKQEMGPTPTPTIEPTPVPIPHDIGGYYAGDGVIVVNLGHGAKKDERNALHEVAHMLDIDIFDNISQSPEFQNAIIAFIEANKTDGLCIRQMICLIQDFPGINGNPMRVITYTLPDGTEITREWGGYFELYAEIYAQWKTGWAELPKELYPFYNIVGQ